MSAQPIHDPWQDPEAILRGLPEQYRPLFLEQYQEAWEAAREPGKYHLLPELLHTWWLSSIAYNDPRHEEAVREILEEKGERIPIEEAIPDWEERLAQAQVRRR
ncbi:DUF6247 family protein [Planotetraspora sp. A-T 1434]|uniref:DUF6247 family protein n=1 Tax=Planotetraspora sp. A-T 1434 TaxID=2979219 RepID=UPI0021C0CFEC|nr:DUF6247 family protein [Planotetraspora sp. A-T 1434]MCT9930798.1 DUF6247 family protein [Planotetraspora sp. A-T 1434]